MKKLLLAATIATLTASAAHAAPTVYGKMHVSVDSMDEFGATKADTDNVIKVNSNASRIGVKGDEKLTDNLSVIYLAEWQVNTDGDGADLDMRNRFVGLKYDGVGAVKVGRIDSHLKNAQGKVDYFNDMHVLDMGKTLAGENRLNNVISLESDPKALGGFSANVMLQQGENTKLSGNSDEVSDSVGDAISASLVYENKDAGLFAALAGDKNVVSTFAANGKKAEADVIRVVGSLDLGALANVTGLTLNAMFQTAEPTNLSAAVPAVPPATTGTPAGDFRGFDKENSFLVSAGYKIGDTPWSVKAQYEQSTTEYTTAGSKDVELSQIGGMVDYQFNSKTRAYGYVAQKSDDRKGVEDLNYVGLGLEFNF
jgi:predicted porin